MTRNFSNNLSVQMKKFRTEVLKISLSEMCRILNVPVTTLYNFENGNSTNVNNVEWYEKMCKDIQTYYLLKEYLSNWIEIVMCKEVPK